jgi:hypothetical protein
MKKISIRLLAILAVILVGCSGSDTYRGSWKATDSKGGKFELFFDAKNFTVKDSLGKSKKYEYTQNSVEIENSVATYGIQLGDGRAYQINFPNADDESLGLIKDENGNPLYTISRKKYIKYEDVFKL